MDTLPQPPASIVIPRPRNHEAHRTMLQNHANAKKCRRELHKRTSGRTLKYAGNLF